MSFWTALVRWRELNDPSLQASGLRLHAAGSKSEVQSPESEVAGSDSACPSAGFAAQDTTSGSGGGLHAKISLFLERFARWRRMARQGALSRCLENILGETQYADWLATQPRGEQRCANIKRLLLLAQRFDQLQRQGLFRFLRFIEAQQRAETEPELTAVSAENAARLMSIHQSKGLEFPVVVLADLGKALHLATCGRTSSWMSNTA